METKIYPSYAAFLKRENQDSNGVSQTFADGNPAWEKMNKTNKACWSCSGCSDCLRCSGCSDCSDCSGCSDCLRCSGCSGCSDCLRCSGCSDCLRCSGCSDMALAKATTPGPMSDIPKIKDIHQKIFAAASGEGALNMGDWHTCETTHCRAGWVVHLAGEKGRALEVHTTTAFAAQMIYNESSTIPVFPPRFYESNEVALADMRRCAKLEKSAAAAQKLTP